jgi:putative ATP-binding cassette transporter
LSDWSVIALDEVVHSYASEDGAFVLGPISCAFERGEIVLLAGGNGSGKSTLAKVLTGLYEPEAGAIRVDGRAIGPDDREAYRQLFSAVFSPFYLFDALLGISGDGVDDRARAALDRLGLSSKVTVDGGRLSTIDLSQGQRRRLALVTALLEDRPYFVFDEWAADQDAGYKQWFYTELLPDLKRMGKTALVISHDERYYGAADRVLRLDQGRLEEPAPRRLAVAGGFR